MFMQGVFMDIRIKGSSNTNGEIREQEMAEQPKNGMRNVLLVWVIGLTLGIAAGAVTAMLLLPNDTDTPNSIADLMRHR